MKKTLSLLLALVMVISLFPGFADEKATLTAEEAGAVLQGYGAIKGGSDGNLMIDKELKRQDAVVILTRLMGKEADALATQAAPSFEDITIDYYKPFLAFAEANKWVEGKAEKKFGFNDVVTVKEFTAMLLRALGHDTMGDNYAKVMDLAKEQGLFQGVMAEEAAPVIRGVAFIMMNNTLETAPKGEKQALVYKLGYKEMPKPENLTVVSAEAAGLKAIDVKFSKEVDENTLKSISLKMKKSNISYEPMLIDAMTARLVLTTTAKQDAKYDLVIDAVKTAAGEVVEKFEGSVFMTDQVRPEILSVEAVNPKTLLVKANEPMDFAFNALRKMPEFKIEGKALNGKSINKFNNEFYVELATALKPGDYKVEVTSLKDFAGFIAKTAEFDITVVEDKEAPMVTEAKMLDLNHIKVTFNEGIYSKGTFKVNDETATPVDFKNGDKEIKLLLTKKPLDIGAVVEVKVEYKGQKDIMGNTVKDMAKFTFKVEDDATIPEVKEVTVNGNVISVKFTKVMLIAGANYQPKYTILKSGKVFAKGNISGDWKEDNTVLKLKVASLSGKNAQDYTLVLEGLKDATLRMNPMPKTELPLSGKDTLSPQAEQHYATSTDSEGIYTFKIFFNEEMDEETLLDAKNYTFDKYKGKAGEVRADSTDVSFSSEEGGKIVVIEGNDKTVKELGSIALVGLKDKAGNPLDKSNLTAAPAGKVIAKPLANQQKVKEAALYRNAEGKLELRIKVEYAINDFTENTGVIELISAGAANPKVSALTLIDRISNKEFIFSVNNEEHIFTDAETDLPAADQKINLNILKAEAAMSVINDPLSLGGFTAVADEIAPRVIVKDDAVLTLAADIKSINEDIFDEDIVAASFVGTVSKVDGTEVQNLTVAGRKVSWANTLANGEYVLKFTQAKDTADNNAAVKDVFFKVGAESRIQFDKFDKIQAGAGKTSIVLNFTKNVKNLENGSVNAADYVLKLLNSDGTDKKVIAVTDAKADGSTKTLTIEFGAETFAAGEKLQIEIKKDAQITDNAIATDIVEGTWTEVVVTP